MKNKTIRVTTIFIIIMTMLLGCSTSSFASSKTKSMNVYNDAYKIGSTVYCCDDYSIYKVNLNTKSVKKLTSPSVSGVGKMKPYGNYVYFVEWSEGTSNSIARVKKAGGSYKSLTSMQEDDRYAISKYRIYYKTMSYYSDRIVSRSMKLDGTSDKSSTYGVKNRVYRTNTKGYYTYNIESSDFDPYEGTGYVTTYLVTPNGKIKLAKLYGKNLW